MKASCVLALGGLDPGGGAGILADARAIVRAGAFPCAVATVLTVQSTRGMKRATPVDAKLWTEQARIVLRDQNVRAIKIGALGSIGNVRAAAELLDAHARLPVVLDPVMLPTRGKARLLEERALDAMRRALVPHASIVMANATEAEVLAGARVRDAAEARAAGRALLALGAGAVLVKGGHLRDARGVDVLVTRDRTLELTATRLRLRRHVHGGGCVLASLVAGRFAVGDDVFDAVRFAKWVHHASLDDAVDVGGLDAVMLLK